MPTFTLSFFVMRFDPSSDAVTRGVHGRARRRRFSKPQPFAHDLDETLGIAIGVDRGLLELGDEVVDPDGVVRHGSREKIDVDLLLGEETVAAPRADRVARAEDVQLDDAPDLRMAKERERAVVSDHAVA